MSFYGALTIPWGDINDAIPSSSNHVENENARGFVMIIKGCTILVVVVIMEIARSG